MEPISLSILVVICKDYKPSHDWYFRKSKGGIFGAAKAPKWPDYDEERHKEFNYSHDYVLMPECPGMSDEEAVEVVRIWCVNNNIPYIDDFDCIETAYHWYYKFGEYNGLDYK